MTRTSLYLKPGDDETRVFQYVDSSGNVVDITGYTAVWTGVVGSTTVTETGTVSGSEGKVSVTVADTDTTSLGTAGVIGYYDLKITSSGGVDTTIATGAIVMINH